MGATLSAEGARAREPSCFAPTRRSSAPQPPDAGVTYREYPADVGPLLEAADQLQARDESEML